jgi:hypothetical protein
MLSQTGHTPEAPIKVSNPSLAISTILHLQRARDFEKLARLAGITVYRSHIGWGWQRSIEKCMEADFSAVTDAWEASCYETGLMESPLIDPEVDPSHTEAMRHILEKL